MACKVEGNGMFLCQETVEFWAGRLTPIVGSDVANGLRSDPLPLEILLFALIVGGGLFFYLVFDRYHRRQGGWWWGGHD